MRINKYIAHNSVLSRRAADEAVAGNRVLVNGITPEPGMDVWESDVVTLDGIQLQNTVEHIYLLMHKPVGYVCSRNGQGSDTVYDLLPNDLKHLNSVGRLDKNSSGLLLFTNDGVFQEDLTHPSNVKQKIYNVTLDHNLAPLHRQMIQDHGLTLSDGISRLALERITDGVDTMWRVSMHEGRNRQIRRTFNSVGYNVIALHRIQFGQYSIGDLPEGSYRLIDTP